MGAPASGKPGPSSPRGGPVGDRRRTILKETHARRPKNLPEPVLQPLQFRHRIGQGMRGPGEFALPRRLPSGDHIDRVPNPVGGGHGFRLRPDSKRGPPGPAPDGRSPPRIAEDLPSPRPPKYIRRPGVGRASRGVEHLEVENHGVPWRLVPQVIEHGELVGRSVRIAGPPPQSLCRANPWTWKTKPGRKTDRGQDPGENVAAPGLNDPDTADHARGGEDGDGEIDHVGKIRFSDIGHVEGQGGGESGAARTPGRRRRTGGPKPSCGASPTPPAPPRPEAPGSARRGSRWRGGRRARRPGPAGRWSAGRPGSLRRVPP